MHPHFLRPIDGSLEMPLSLQGAVKAVSFDLSERLIYLSDACITFRPNSRIKGTQENVQCHLKSIKQERVSAGPKFCFLTKQTQVPFVTTV